MSKIDIFLHINVLYFSLMTDTIIIFTVAKEGFLGILGLGFFSKGYK